MWVMAGRPYNAAHGTARAVLPFLWPPVCTCRRPVLLHPCLQAMVAELSQPLRASTLEALGAAPTPGVGAGGMLLPGGPPASVAGQVMLALALLQRAGVVPGQACLALVRQLLPWAGRMVATELYVLVRQICPPPRLRACLLPIRLYSLGCCTWGQLRHFIG